MSKQLINAYRNQLDKIIRFGGTKNETSVRRAFISLINSYAEKKNLLLVEEVGVLGKAGKTVYPDGTLKNALRIEFGYWESKDEKDTLEAEIHTKLNVKGYPDSNILFEDTREAVLFQEGSLVQKVRLDDDDALDRILNAFVNYVPAKFHKYAEALEQFTNDVPTIVKELRHLLEIEAEQNSTFRAKRDHFYALAQSEINPEITLEDVREMIIQHILTEDIFNNVFGNSNFHRFNNIAKELEAVIDKFMTYAVRQSHLASIKSYYDTIRDAASGIADHHEKQKFLKNIYENFYKVYNPKGADRLGVVYTPNEIVRFMIESTDYLLEKHFNRSLADKNVEILDPATGTGTFIAELIEYISPNALPYKYEHELHANEVAILPYYIANLNIEYTYQQKMTDYKEFRNICFVDTLDNTDALNYSGKQDMLFGISSENALRIKKQNEKKISVIIGNPPYNANQANFNDFNKNREYAEIDKRIKDTYVKHSTAQKTKVYDMYARFLRWASDRIDKNGIIAFVTNSSFIDSKTFDGFRKVVAEEFNELWIVDLKGNANTSGERRKREDGNIFNDKIKVGVAIYFLIKNEDKDNCKIYYNAIEDYKKAFEKLDYIRNNKISDIAFERVIPSKQNNWINIADVDNDFETLLPLIDKDVKLGKKEDAAIFELYSLGVATNRDIWNYDFDKETLQQKSKFFCDYFEKSKEEYLKLKNKKDFNDSEIKFTEEILDHFDRNSNLKFDSNKIRTSSYRPFTKKWTYFDKIITHRMYQQDKIFGNAQAYKNIVLCWNSNGKDIRTLATNRLPDLHFIGDSQCMPFFRYNSEGHQLENITDWALQKFQANYQDSTITKQDIFHYVYAVLHHPNYRQKYELNLKREFPRIPFYDDFHQWATWGKLLMDLHIDYESQVPFELNRRDAETQRKTKYMQNDLFNESNSASQRLGGEDFVATPKTKLKADKANGIIEIDSVTQLTGIPEIAWEYKLGNRSALEWILDQYKERKPQDATIAEKFNTYKFEDYKETVIELLKKVCTVSVETQKIIEEMKKK